MFSSKKIGGQPKLSSYFPVSSFDCFRRYCGTLVMAGRFIRNAKGFGTGFAGVVVELCRRLPVQRCLLAAGLRSFLVFRA